MADWAQLGKSFFDISIFLEQLCLVTGAVVKMQGGMSISHTRVPSIPNSSFLLMHLLESSRWKLKQLGPVSLRGDPDCFELPALAWPSPGCCRHLRSELENGKSVSFCLCFFQTNKKKKNKNFLKRILASYFDFLMKNTRNNSFCLKAIKIYSFSK